MRRRLSALFAIALLTACGSDQPSRPNAPDGDELAKEVNDAVTDAGSFRFEMYFVTSGLGASAQRATSEGFHDFDGPTMQMVSDPVDQDPTDMQTSIGGERRLIGDTVYEYPRSYTRSGDFVAEDYWLERPADTPVDAKPGSLSYADHVLALLSVPRGLKIEQQKRTDGGTTYTGTIDQGDAPMMANVNAQAEFSVTVADDGLPAEMRWSVIQDGPDGPIEMVIETTFHDFGVDQEVKRPPDSEIITMDEYQEFLDESAATISP